MRTSFVLFLLLGLLCLGRSSSLFNALSRYRLAKAAKVLISLPPAQGYDARFASESLAKSEDDSLDSALGAGFEIVVLLGISLIIWKIRNKIDSAA
jgi:hypothetical protein